MENIHLYVRSGGRRNVQPRKKVKNRTVERTKERKTQQGGRNEAGEEPGGGKGAGGRTRDESQNGREEDVGRWVLVNINRRNRD